MPSRARLLISAMIALTVPLALGGCRDGAQDRAELAPLDDGLTNTDPAIKSALEDQIMVDPKLANQANQNAVTPGNQPVDGGAPAIANPKAAAAAEAQAKAAVGTLLRAPAPSAFDADCKTCGQRPATLGALAREQSGGSCDAKLAYGNEWANRMPASFPVYPRAMVVEAAGVAGGKCNIRVVNFQTGASKQAVLDYYYTLANKAGYSAEHQVKGGEHYLGGTRGEQAFVVMLRQDGAMVDADIVVSGGR